MNKADQSEGEKLKLSIKGSGDTVEAAAAKLEISRRTLHNYYKMEVLDNDIKRKVKDILGITIAQIEKQNFRPNALQLGEPVGTYNNKAGNEFIELSDGTYIMTTPLVTKKAYAGYITGWGDPEYLEELPKHTINVDKPHSGEYISIEIVGQSMNDGTGRSFVPGDIATGRKINRKLWKDSKLHLKSYQEFIIVHKNGILLKAITEHNTANNTITIHSYNPDKEEYPDQVIKLEDVLQIFNVVKNTQNRSNKI